MSESWDFDPVAPQPFVPENKDYSGFDLSDMEPDLTPIGDDGWPDITIESHGPTSEMQRLDDLYRLEPSGETTAASATAFFSGAKEKATGFLPKKSGEVAEPKVKEPKAKKVRGSTVAKRPSSGEVVVIKPLPLAIGAAGVVLMFFATTIFKFGPVDSIMKWPLIFLTLLMGYGVTQKRGVMSGMISIIAAVGMVFLLKWTVLLVPILIVGAFCAYLFLDRD